MHYVNQLVADETLERVDEYIYLEQRLRASAIHEPEMKRRDMQRNVFR